jgi:hypothetical protein
MLIALLLLVAVISLDISWTSPGDQRRTVNDFTADYLSARAWINGRSAYAHIDSLAGRYVADPLGVTSFYGGRHHRNPHPPAYIVLVTPLALLPYVPARNIWMIAMASSLALAMGMVAKASGARGWAAVGIGAGSLALPPALSELKLGGADTLILLGISVAWLQLLKGRQIWGGIVLGLASAVKLYPLFLLIPLLRRGDRKAAGTQLVTAAAAFALSGFALGTHSTVELLTRAMPANARYWLADPHNLSILAIPIRWLTHSAWYPHGITAPLWAHMLAGALAIVCVVAAARTPARMSQDLMWAAVPWMLLISPLFWYQYIVLVLPTIYLIFQNHLRERLSPPWFVLIATGFLLVWTLGFIPFDTTSVPVLVGVFALPTYGLCVIGLSEWRPARSKGLVIPANLTGCLLGPERIE